MRRVIWGALALGTAAVLLPVAMAARGESKPVQSTTIAAAAAEATDPAARSVALFAEMSKVMQHPRCINCHPRTDRPLQGEASAPHLPPVVRGADGHGAAGLECATCHSDANVAFANGEGSIPGAPDWHLAPVSMAWEGKSPGDICRQIKDPARNGGKSLAALVEHNSHDALIAWGWAPGKGRVAVPGTQAAFGALTRAWVESGAHCPA